MQRSKKLARLEVESKTIGYDEDGSSSLIRTLWTTTDN
jgi:hypothetical protein